MRSAFISISVIASAITIAEATLTLSPAAAQAQAEVRSSTSSRITITLPREGAQLVVNGQAQEGISTRRVIETPPLRPGATNRYTFAVTWQPNPYTTMTRTRTLTFRTGDAVNVDLTLDDPADRVRVIYVPTPDDIVQEMVKLAGVTAADVVFEPGCGDARLTIAAVKAGARRGVGIDIDPERVEESRLNVKAAGLANRIEIREADALEIPDLGSATVVLLYMGEHFNMLLRPKLWQRLPVGARVVSHRFTMGDWKPDRTVTVPGFDGGTYELHLWTITEDLKKR